MKNSLQLQEPQFYLLLLRQYFKLYSMGEIFMRKTISVSHTSYLVIIFGKNGILLENTNDSWKNVFLICLIGTNI